MDIKSLHTLEFPKILERLAAHCAFSVSADKARNLLPASSFDEVQRRQAVTREAASLLTSHPDLSIGGARDIRAAVNLAKHGGVLLPNDLLDIKSTLIAARTLARLFERVSPAYPNLSAIASRISSPHGLIEAISRAISEHGDILDDASPELATIRRDLRLVHERLLAKMQRMISDPKNAPLLQEALITQRDGRYVIPLRAEFKGRIKAIVHDQSASGATLFVEPLAVVELNNQYRELQLAERDEERRVLANLSAQVGIHANEIMQTLDAIAELDLAFACAKYAQDLAAVEPGLHPLPPTPKPDHPGSVIRLYQARHPLLDPETVVPIDVELDSRTFALVITGPNTGGKTVTLKTIGLLVLMAQAGLHIPVQSGSEISVFHNVFADIGDEQSIEQSLSTFSGHITNIIRILQQADHRSLVILDELGAGTDPQEGAALARALLSHLLERRITTLVTTHHPELKVFAHTTPGVVNASVEFDLETLRPTYHLTIGLPGRSNALAIAQRLGMPEQIIAAAKTELSPADLQAEDLLDEIHRQRDLARQARAAAEAARQGAEHLRAQLAERLERIEDERREALENARIEAESQLQALQEEIRQLRRALTQARQSLLPVQQIQEKVADLEERLEKSFARPIAKEDRFLHRPLRVGDRVRLRTLNTQGVITALDEDEAEVQVGRMRVRASLVDLRPLADSVIASTEEPPHHQPSRFTALAPSPGPELDLRGQRADEALDSLERYLDSAYLAGLPFVRIIHGKGSGKLRQAVRQALQNHPNVRAFESGGDQEGGEGVTIVKLSS